MSRALITGITGQDGFYLAKLLLNSGSEVVGLTHNFEKVESSLASQLPNCRLIDGDMENQASLERALKDVQPDEVYNLAAFSSPSQSWLEPERCCNITGLGVLRLLEAVRVHAPGARLLQASSSEIFGRATGKQQDESTPLEPRSPYGAAKSLAHTLVGNYREAYGLHASSAILYSHESPRRGINFVTRKISRGVAAIALGQATHIRLGNMEARRDWGHAADYTEAMRMIQSQEQPGDYIIASGTTHSLSEFISMAFAAVGILDWAEHIIHDPSLLRPLEPESLCGDPHKAHTVLGWSPTHSFSDLVGEMVANDIKLLSQ